MLRILALLALLAPLVAGATDAATSAAKIVKQGNGKGAAPCMACHGVDGGGMEATGYPRLAGLDAAYLQRQLDDFANGTRANSVMQPNASALSEDERAALAKYYSAMPLPARFAKPATAPDAKGERLATRGDWSRELPGCVQCHAPGGVGVGASFPPLAGQPAAYIEAQLRAWQQGTRHNDPLALMQHVAKQLTPQEIQAVAGWFAAQPLPATGSTP
ncbi:MULTISPECIES: c-type cytochrome [unclassified Rhodanobacter]|uniref:Cytochrome c n=1 Tax=Rhodanobacter humi TaxID=1888173 RepID=A0ABV4APZ9_9GAMM